MSGASFRRRENGSSERFLATNVPIARTTSAGASTNCRPSVVRCRLPAERTTTPVTSSGWPAVGSLKPTRTTMPGATLSLRCSEMPRVLTSRTEQATSRLPTCRIAGMPIAARFVARRSRGADGPLPVEPGSSAELPPIRSPPGASRPGLRRPS